MDRQVLAELFNVHFDASTKNTAREGSEKIATAIFILAIAVTEAANDLCYELKQQRLHDHEND